MTPQKEEDLQEIVIPSALPLLAVRDVVVFPNMVLPLFVGRESSVLAIESALAQDRLLFLATQRDQTIENPEPEDIYDLGTVSLILRMLKLPDGRLKILVQGNETPGRPPENSGAGQGQGESTGFFAGAPPFSSQH
jgi:ATP-dependent Lon protease